MLQTCLSETYEYDGLDRLSCFARSCGAFQSWGLDSLGNWASFNDQGDDQYRDHDAANQTGEITGDLDWVDPEHDAAGNMILAPRPGQESCACEALLLVYDGWNRLAKAYEDSDGGGEIDEGDTLIAEYQYDGQARRIVKIVPASADWNHTDYLYNESWQCLEERTDTFEDLEGEGGAQETVATVVSVQYLPDIRYIDAMVLRWRSVEGTLDEVMYYTQDANYNTTALIAQSTGLAVERTSFAAYGQATFYGGDWSTRSESEFASEILYAGYRHDPETGLYQVRFRYYHPTMGLWPGRDVAEYADTLNLHQYSRSSPGQYVDPFGLEAHSPGLPAYEPVAGDSKALANPKAGALAEKGKFCHLYRKWPDYTLEIKLGQGLGGWGGGTTVAIVRTAASLVGTVVTTVGEKILGRVASVAGRLDYPVWHGTLTYRTREGEAHYEAVCKKAEDGTESWVWSDKAYYTYARWVDEKATTKEFGQRVGPVGMPARVPLIRTPLTGELRGTKEMVEQALQILRTDLLGQVTAFLQHRNFTDAPPPKVNDKADFRYIKEGP